jgi:hypothetical protein
MVLMQRVRVTELEGKTKVVRVGLTHERRVTQGDLSGIQVEGALVAAPPAKPQWLWIHTSDNRILLAVQGRDFSVKTNFVHGAKSITNFTELTVALQPKASSEFVIKLPSPLIAASEHQEFLTLDYEQARAATVKFWSDYLDRGARFAVPEEAVNTLFRANLWHALRLPRRHAKIGGLIKIDLPYSNFAYDQHGTPWPVNQAVYVDYMLYDLRGYHELAAEELEAIFDNQDSNGHVGGFANWGVYTPSVVYAVAKHYLLSGDGAYLEKLRDHTRKASQWCFTEMILAGRAEREPSLVPGLILAPLNDLSHGLSAWAFNQAYFFAAMDLEETMDKELDRPKGNPLVSGGAGRMRSAIEWGFGRACMLSPLVQLRDRTWSPYVPSDALAPQRLLKTWYPTDVDTGALHLSRLKALDPKGPLTTALLLDHEDNLFFKGLGMANEPVYNQQATVYLLRDEPKAAIRTFYSMMACAFSHSVFEPVEHRWGWGQYFGPPSTDGAWFELYRHMLIHEWEDDNLLLLQATPRKWLEHSKRIQVERAPTYYGPLNMVVESRVQDGRIQAGIDLPQRKQPRNLLVRFRHPDAKPIRKVSVNGQDWKNFDNAKEWIQIPSPKAGHYEIIANY